MRRLEWSVNNGSSLESLRFCCLDLETSAGWGCWANYFKTSSHYYSWIKINWYFGHAGFWQRHYCVDIGPRYSPKLIWCISYGDPGPIRSSSSLSWCRHWPMCWQQDAEAFEHSGTGLSHAGTVLLCSNGRGKWKTWPAPGGLYHCMSEVQWMCKNCIEVEEVCAKTFTFFGGCKFVQFDIHQLQLTLESMHLVVDFNFFISLIKFCLGKNSVNSCERVS